MSPLASRIVLAIARLEPSGCMPFAPGTWGSLFSVFLAFFLFLPLPFWARIVALILFFILGTWVSTIGANILQKKDPSEIVIDELVGQWIVLLPLSSFVMTPTYILQLFIAFALFRFFDILKPYPIKMLEDIFPDGLGIMADDVLAGIYALICFMAIRYFFF